MTLEDFLLARIAEDESDAHAHPDPNMWDHNPRGWFDPDRVLAECIVKRRIVELHGENLDGCVTCAAGANSADGFAWVDPAAFPCATLRLLALPYADHPDYDQAWRP